MKKYTYLLLAVLLTASACTSANTSASSAASGSSAEPAVLDEGTYKEYQDSVSSRPAYESYTVSAMCRYDLIFNENNRITFALDGVLESENGNEGKSHVTQYINSDGLTSIMDGYYYDGRLYNSYNGITYYEEMKQDDIKAMMLVPLDPYPFRQEQVASVDKTEGSDGSVTYTVVLNDAAASEMFTARYDQYALDELDSFKVRSGTIVNTFDSEGYLTKEIADFDMTAVSSGTEINITYSGEVSYVKINETTIAISDELREEQLAYVNFADIDTDAISTETAADDSAEPTVTDTFRKRVMSRLGYEKLDNGSYRTIFNENESYTVNFDNCTFEYSNYSITYSYSWKNDVGSMGACTYTFNDGQHSSSCADSTIETINKVKSYLEMELYYCGLSLDDLQNEAK